MRRKITLKQIAKELEVSVSTVSKALKDSKEISLDTRQKVQAFAKLYNYKPNNIAISLKNRRTKNIAVIIPEIVHHFFATVISGVEKIANSKGYNVIVCVSNESFDKEVINMEMLANGSIDGFIMSISKETLKKKDFHHLREVINQGMPLVLFDRAIDEIQCDKVIIDDVEGAYKAVSHLVTQGCKKIALLTTVDYVNVGKLRTSGYRKALEDHGMTIDENLILKIEDVENCDLKIERLFEENTFDGLFAVNELFALSAMRIARDKGMKIPDDIAIIGFTDGILSRNVIPSLSTIAQHGFEMGEKAVSLLIDKIEEIDDEESFKTEIIKTSLLKRETSVKK